MMLLNKFSRLKGVGRYACLGTAVLNTLGRRYKFHNIQKGRVDYLIRAIDEPATRCMPEQAVPHLARGYVAYTIEQQAALCPDLRPEIVFVDSFSELTDQLFRHKTEGWQFCCNYDDLRHDEGFNNLYECLGLLDLTGLMDDYRNMLRSISDRWGDIPVIYLHFPDALEGRDIFIQRARHIRQVVEECGTFFPNLHSFSVPCEIVKPPAMVELEMTGFPYHYDQKTYDAFAEMILGKTVLRKYF